MPINTEEEYWNMRFNEEQRLMAIYYEDLCYQSCRPSTIYKPKLSIDGNMHCALYGENPMEGCAGFGKSPKEAYEDFDRNWIDHDNSRWEVLNKTVQEAKNKKTEPLQKGKVKSCEECDLSTSGPGNVWCSVISFYVTGYPSKSDRDKGCPR